MRGSFRLLADGVAPIIRSPRTSAPSSPRSSTVTPAAPKGKTPLGGEAGFSKNGCLESGGLKQPCGDKDVTQRLFQAYFVVKDFDFVICGSTAASVAVCGKSRTSDFGLPVVVYRELIRYAESNSAILVMTPAENGP